MSGRPRPDRCARASGAHNSDNPRFGDTFAWLLAAASVVGPILLILIAAVSLAYGLIHLVFLR
ncbi:MAG: hypothetical protein EA403_08260 [Spirochaetaceae bacterium]|nr:MAG: hypothetical protein EA403_08260 [Spirochaetaceae bacterium]